MIMPLRMRQDHAQSHALGHDEYRDWASERTPNCCNNEDCRALADNEWRETNTSTEILIKGKWCPVQKRHFILRGKSPDWNVVHACILGNNFYPANESIGSCASPGGRSGSPYLR
jgi:hypothetical protein